MGRGSPLVGISWLNRPLHFDWFVGALFGDDPIRGEVRQGTDFFGGYRVGADLDHYWGTELRAGWGQLNASNVQGPPRTRRSDVFISDVSVLYYPWGDARWRPYAQLGLGVANFDFVDQNGFGRNETLVGMPIGGGVKFQFRRWLAMRADVLDNMAFGGNRLSTMHNVSLTIGFEIHWGARRPSYWPWQPSRHTW